MLVTLGGAAGGYVAGPRHVIDYLVQRSRPTMAMFYTILVIVGIIGIAMLRVENRFIDNFKSSTEIYRGMVRIDQELGGTTPLDIIIDADPAFIGRQSSR